MWDAKLEAMRDRKLNEMVVFAAMVRTDISKRHEYIEIIDKLNLDLDVIEAICADREPPKSEPIVSELYRSRLSKMELLDEYCLDALRNDRKQRSPPKEEKMEPEQPKVEEAEPAQALEPAEPQQAIEPAEEKPRIKAPERIPAIKAPDKVESLEGSETVPAIEPAEEQPKIEAPEEVQAIDAPAKVESIESAEEAPVLEASEPSSTEEKPAEEEKPEEKAEPKGANDDVFFDLILSMDDAVTLKNVKAMKDSKIDLFIDREMNGHFNEDACEDVIEFLKTDLTLIDMILSINLTDKSDIENKFRNIIAFVSNANEPQHQKLYFNSLNKQESDLEGKYNEVLKKLEEVINGRYSYILEGNSSIFFEE